MGQPAARVGDATTHGTPLGPGPGSFNVLIGGQPAWRAITDSHACPVSSPNPHTGGVVGIASTTVFINNLPAVRMGDQVTEAGPPNPIMAGDFTVLIG